MGKKKRGKGEIHQRVKGLREQKTATSGDGCVSGVGKQKFGKRGKIANFGEKKEGKRGNFPFSPLFGEKERGEKGKLAKMANFGEKERGEKGKFTKG